jgi:WD40 repeat protein
MQENELHGWRLPDKTDLRMSGYAAKTRSFSWDKRGRWLATSGADRAVIWPFSGKGPQGREPLLLAPRQALVTRVAFHPSEERLAIGYADGAVLIAHLTDQSLFEIAPAGEAPINALAWRADGAQLTYADDAGYAAIVSA